MLQACTGQQPRRLAITDHRIPYEKLLLIGVSHTWHINQRFSNNSLWCRHHSLFRVHHTSGMEVVSWACNCPAHPAGALQLLGIAVHDTILRRYRSCRSAGKGQAPPGVMWLSCWPYKQHAPACSQTQASCWVQAGVLKPLLGPPSMLICELARAHLQPRR